jgi:hypothetical protein
MRTICPLRSGLGLRELRPDCLDPLASFGRFLSPVRRRINQLLKIGRELRCQSFADLAKQRFDLGEHSYVFAVRVIEKLEADGAVIDQPCGHIPIGHNHAQMAAVPAHQEKCRLTRRKCGRLQSFSPLVDIKPDIGRHRSRKTQKMAA